MNVKFINSMKLTGGRFVLLFEKEELKKGDEKFISVSLDRSDFLKIKEKIGDVFK